MLLKCVLGDGNNICTTIDIWSVFPEKYRVDFFIWNLEFVGDYFEYCILAIYRFNQVFHVSSSFLPAVFQNSSIVHGRIRVSIIEGRRDNLKIENVRFR